MVGKGQASRGSGRLGRGGRDRDGKDRDNRDRDRDNRDRDNRDRNARGNSSIVGTRKPVSRARRSVVSSTFQWVFIRQISPKPNNRKYTKWLWENLSPTTNQKN